MNRNIFFNYRDWYLDISNSNHIKTEIFSRMDVYNLTYSIEGLQMIDLKDFLCKSVFDDEDFVLINDNLPNILYFFSLVVEDYDLKEIIPNLNQDFVNVINDRYRRLNRFDQGFSTVVDNLLIDREESLVSMYIETGFIFMFKEIIEKDIKWKEAIRKYLHEFNYINVSRALAIASVAYESQTFLNLFPNEIINFFLVNLNPFDNPVEWKEHKIKLTSLMSHVDFIPENYVLQKCLRFGVTDILRFENRDFIEDWISFCVCGNEYEDKPFSEEFKSFGCVIDILAFRGRSKEKELFELLVESWKYESFKEGIEKFDNENMNYLYELFNCLWGLDVDFIQETMVGLRGIPMMKDSFEEKYKNLTFRYSEDGEKVEFIPLGGKIQF